jgi:hypothetical protein
LLCTAIVDRRHGGGAQRKARVLSAGNSDPIRESGVSSTGDVAVPAPPGVVMPAPPEAPPNAERAQSEGRAIVEQTARL